MMQSKLNHLDINQNWHLITSGLVFRTRGCSLHRQNTNLRGAKPPNNLQSRLARPRSGFCPQNYSRDDTEDEDTEDNTSSPTAICTEPDLPYDKNLWEVEMDGLIPKWTLRPELDPLFYASDRFQPLNRTPEMLVDWLCVSQMVVS